jgi:hypothetical protein
MKGRREGGMQQGKEGWKEEQREEEGLNVPEAVPCTHSGCSKGVC